MMSLVYISTIENSKKKKKKKLLMMGLVLSILSINQKNK